MINSRTNMRRRCPECYDFAPSINEILITMPRLQVSAARGCPRCELLRRSSIPFESRFPYSKDDTIILIQRAISTCDDIIHINLVGLVEEDVKAKLKLNILKTSSWDIPWGGFKSRRIPYSDSRSGECLDLMKSWIQICATDHEDCRDSSRFRPEALNAPKRILKISKADDGMFLLKLQEFPSAGCDFIALSYCWGDSTKVLKTTKDTFQHHFDVGIKQEDLPRVFLDAVELTSRLGLQYVWIDSLCILQGDPDDFKEEAPKMGDIYAGAHLVLAAAHARDVTQGLHVGRSGPHHVQFTTSTGHEVKAHVQAGDEHRIWRVGEQYWPVDELPLFSRAWAFQERLQAKRVVHFTPSELVWECRTCIQCECGELQTSDLAWPEFNTSSNFKTKFNNVVRWGSNVERLDFWHDIAAQYSSRKLTHSSDRLPALSSLASSINHGNLLGSYYAGIWEVAMPAGLLWWSELPGLGRNAESSEPSHFRCPSSNVPTWSWLSIQGRVSTWGRCPRIMVDVFHINYRMTTKDRYGPCGTATVSLIGRTSSVKIKRTIGPPSTPYSVEFANTRGLPPLFIPDTNPFEYDPDTLDDESIVALFFGMSHTLATCMILVQCPSSYDVYKRIGIADVQPEYFQSSTRRLISLV